MDTMLGCSAKKTKRRIRFVDSVVNALKSEKTYGVIGRGNKEQQVATYLHGVLLDQLFETYKDLNPHFADALAKKHAKHSLLWEGDKNTTINHIQFLGTQHRPDFIIQFDRIRIAIELKRGESGQIIREALGQCLVYSSQFEFSCCVVVDTSKDKKVLRAFQTGTLEKEMLDRLWENYNIRLVVV